MILNTSLLIHYYYFYKNVRFFLHVVHTNVLCQAILVKIKYKISDFICLGLND